MRLDWTCQDDCGEPWEARGCMMQRARARQAAVLLEDNEDRSRELLANPGDMARVQAHKVVFDNRR
jgi:hypothetical protein